MKRTKTKGQPRDLKGMKKRRLRAGDMFASGKKQAYVVNKLGVSRPTVSRWYHAWKKDGRKGLLGAGRAGRKPKLTSAQLGEIVNALRRSPHDFGYATNLWTLERLSKVIEKLTGVRFHPGHVWRLMSKIGWSLQRPAKRARERNEKIIKEWIATEWIRVKKKRSDDTPGSSSKTKAASPNDPLSEPPGLQ